MITSHCSPRASSTRRLVRPPHGRLLVECLVGMVLLSAAGAAFMAGTQASALLTDDALMVARAHSLSAAASERTQYESCTAAGAARAQDLPRVHVVSTPAPDGKLRAASIAATLQFSPLARAGRNAAATLALSSGRECE